MTGRTRILVVDDDAQVRTLLRNVLEMEGYAVSEAASGEQMFSLLEKEPVYLITLDLNLAARMVWRWRARSAPSAMCR